MTECNLPAAIFLLSTGSIVCLLILPDPGEVDFGRGHTSQPQPLGPPGIKSFILACLLALSQLGIFVQG